MLDPSDASTSTEDPLEDSHETGGTNSSIIQHFHHGAIHSPLSKSMEDFLFDRFSTKLEDPLTGRRIR